jgi:septal ring factor EnvC (AmiA/AmiB activator)
MFTDLTEATREYWQQLDEVEAAYKRDELTIQEVDAEVQRLMTELGDARRRALKDFGATLQGFVSQQRETIAGVAAIVALAYLWLVNVA